MKELRLPWNNWHSMSANGLIGLSPEEQQSRLEKALATVGLSAYEDSHPDLCSLVPSQDEFYGANSTGKLARFIQWIYVPAVKDVGAEGLTIS